MENNDWHQITDFRAPEVVAKYDVYPLMHKALGRPAFLRFVGDVKDQSIVDLGCGSGHLCDQLQRNGASCVGIDVSTEFIDIARSRYPLINFFVANGSSMPFVASGSVDKVILSMVVLSIPTRSELEAVFAECARILNTRGELILSTIHPLNMHQFKDGAREIELPQEWNYFHHGSRFQVSVQLTDGSQMNIVNAHWTLQDISRALAKAGFAIEQLEEPELPANSEYFDQLKDLLIVPYYLFFRAISTELS